MVATRLFSKMRPHNRVWYFHLCILIWIGVWWFSKGGKSEGLENDPRCRKGLGADVLCCPIRDSCIQVCQVCCGALKWGASILPEPHPTVVFVGSLCRASFCG